MPVTTPVVCRACNADVTNARRIKSPKGFFYCEPCALAAKQRAAGGNVPPAPVPTAAKKLPEFCPNCDAPVIGNRRICIKCHRDITQMGEFLAKRAARNKVSTEENVGHAIGKAIKAGLALLLVGIAVFLAYGGYLILHPPGPFDDYPKTREEAVRQMLGDIALGTDAGYEKAFLLISTRIRMTNNPREADRYKMVYTRMHDDFASKYGADWPTKAKIDSEEPGSTEEVVPFRVTLNEDEYHLQTQAQMSISSAVENTMTRDDFPENGKRHFGIRDIEEYSLLPKPKMDPELQKFLQQMKGMQGKNQ